MQQAKVFDFIVVGSGIAGLNSALTLSSFGKVLIITKGKSTDSSTFLAQGGIAADSHQQDTVAAGYNHNNIKAVKQLVKSGQAAIEKLSHLGVQFDKQKDGNLVSSYEAAHSYPRIVHATDFTGREIEKVLIANVVNNKNITIWEDTPAIELITNNNQCDGIKVLMNNIPYTLFSRAVVLATGGVGQLYKLTTNPLIATGDGIAMAYKAGAKIKDMEFIQFHPTALLYDTSPLLLLSEALRGEGALLFNSTYKRFMQKIHPLAELAPRDVVSRAIFQEMKKGNVYLDIRFKTKNFILKRFPNISHELKKRGFDLIMQPIPITPAAHFLCGGIKTDLYGRTTIKNLFAYGECAATGVHGANRLASNSLLEGMVFSEQIQYCVKDLPPKSNVVKSIPRDTATIIPTLNVDTLDKYVIQSNEIKTQIRELMWQYVGIVRTTNGLTTAQKKLRKLQKEIKILQNTRTSFFEVEAMVTVALLITKAAQKREKSLGTHYVNE
jgi:L-aspartate oxidase